MESLADKLILITNIKDVERYFINKKIRIQFLENDSFDEIDKKNSLNKVIIIDDKSTYLFKEFDGYILVKNSLDIIKLKSEKVIYFSDFNFYKSVELFLTLLNGNIHIENDKKKLFKFLDEALINYQEEHYKLEHLEEQEKMILSVFEHEMRTPINIILGNAELLQREIIDIKQLSYLEKIYRSGSQLKFKFAELSWFNSLLNNDMKSSIEEFSLANLVEKTLNSYKAIIDEKKLNLKLNIADNISQSYLGEKEKIEILLMHIISNAVKFTNKGYIEININHVSESLDNETVEIMIKDTGIGFDVSQLDILMKPFNQEENYLDRTSSGLGLGLTITKMLIKWLNIEFEVYSKKNVGSCFNLKIELEKSENVSNIGFENVKLLLVEDSNLNRSLVHGILEPLGIIIMDASNGIEALNILELEEFDIIFMDNYMPIMNGIQASNEIKKMNINIPIIMFSASNNNLDKNIIKKNVISDFIEKNESINGYKKILLKNLPKNKVITLESEQNETLEQNYGKYESIIVEKLLLRFNNNFELIIKLIIDYLEQENLFELNWNNYLNNIDIEESIRYFHTQKGIVRTLESLKLGELLEKAENKLFEKSEYDSVVEKYFKLESLFRKDLQLLLERLQKKNNNADVKIDNLDEYNSDVFVERLNLLKKSLKVHDIRRIKSSIELINKIRLDSNLGKVINHIESLIDNYKYSMATDYIENLLEKEDF